MKNKICIGLFVITVIFSFSSKQQAKAASFNYSNPTYAEIINQPKYNYPIANKERKQGKVKFFDAKKGYGYIVDGTTGVNYSFQKSGCIEGYKSKQNDNVSFEINEGKNKVKAINIKANK